ncbi:hypothetical protein L9F63_016190, partial [Diploptera punctata]
YNEQPEQDSLNEPNSGPEPASLPADEFISRHARPHRTFLSLMDSSELPVWQVGGGPHVGLLCHGGHGQLRQTFKSTGDIPNVPVRGEHSSHHMYLYLGTYRQLCVAQYHRSVCLEEIVRRPSILLPLLRTVMQSWGVSLSRGSAHSRERTFPVPRHRVPVFYLRVGALAFGLGTLVFNGLEMAMHSMMEGACLNDVVFVHPVLHGLFTFLQMHFLFVNSQVLVEKFGLAARFGFMHLAATNLALWVRLIIWESGNEWTYFVHLSQSSNVRGGVSNNIPTPLQLRGFPRSMVTRQQRDLTFSSNVTSYYAYRPISDTHISQVVALHECLNTNSLGQLWTSSMPFLYPFIVQFSLIAAAVTFIMGQNVGRGRIFLKQKKLNGHSKSCTMASVGDHNLRSTWSVDCGGASKGLFLGILCLVAGIVVIIIFLVVKEDEDFPADTIFWLTTGALSAVLGLCSIMTSVGLYQIRKLSTTGQEPTNLDILLSTVSAAGVQLYAVFGIVVGASGLNVRDVTDTSAPRRHAMLLSVSVLQLVQVTLQSILLAECLRRATLTRQQMLTKPARQVVTFLLCSNAVLWAYDTFVTQSWMSQELQLRFFGVLAWGVISRIGLPLLVFYRFHSCVLLLEVWKRSYRTPLLDPGN